ncbi:MAG: ATP synthase subunit C [Pseudomonadota bacterium]
MSWLIVFLTSFTVLSTILLGLVLEFSPNAIQRRQWMKPALFGNLAFFVIAQAAFLLLGIQEASAAAEAVAAVGGHKDISVGMGLAILGAGLPTGLSTIAAGIAVGPIGSASLAALAEKPEMFGRTLVYLGLAEGIAIYGLVMSILLLDRI